MTARETKIATLQRQQDFIQEQLDKIHTTKDNGNASYIYVGYVFPEVVKHFEDEGWTVVKLSELYKFQPVFCFDCSNVKLTPDEVEEEKQYPSSKEVLKELFTSLFKSFPH